MEARNHSNPWQVDWARLARRAVILGSAVAAVIQVYRNARLVSYGFDFHGGAWRAGHDVLVGRSPYPAPDAHMLLVHGNAFITPPPLAIFAIPFSVLPFGAAVALWNVVSALAFAGALRLLNVRDWRLYVLGLCSWPFIASLVMGQPDGIFALLAAAAWRYRSSWRGAVACGVLIAAKLLAAPLLLWLLVTKRFRMAAVAAAATLSVLCVTWGAIGFKGLASYPRLLAADARAFELRSHSAVAAVMRLGGSEQLGRFLAIFFALCLAFTVIRCARGSDVGAFAAALTLGLVLSPILWSHYLVLLFVPLAICNNRVNWVWLMTALFYLSPIEPPPSVMQVILVLCTMSVVSVAATARPRSGRVQLLAVRAADTGAAEPSTLV
jgi:hypothetical protein